eukprot:14568075-Alexandrium_andersonii.AAC.1
MGCRACSLVLRLVPRLVGGLLVGCSACGPWFCGLGLVTAHLVALCGGCCHLRAVLVHLVAHSLGPGACCSRGLSLRPGSWPCASGLCGPVYAGLGALWD